MTEPRLLVAPGSGRAIRSNRFVGFSSAPLPEMVDLLEADDPNTFVSLGSLVFANELSLPPFLVVDLVTASVFLFGDLTLVADETSFSGAEASTWLDSPLPRCGSLSCLPPDDAAPADTNLVRGVVAASGFQLLDPQTTTPARGGLERGPQRFVQAQPTTDAARDSTVAWLEETQTHELGTEHQRREPEPPLEPMAAGDDLVAADLGDATTDQGRGRAADTEIPVDSVVEPPPPANPTGRGPDSWPLHPDDLEMDTTMGADVSSSTPEPTPPATGNTAPFEMAPPDPGPMPAPDRVLPPIPVLGVDSASEPTTLPPHDPAVAAGTAQREIAYVLLLDDGTDRVITSGAYVGRNPTKRGNLPPGYVAIGVQSESVSRVHWTLIIDDDGGVQVQDLGSTAGTQLVLPGTGARTGVPVDTPVPIAVGTVILFGDRSATLTDPAEGRPLP